MSTSEIINIYWYSLQSLLRDTNRRTLPLSSVISWRGLAFNVDVPKLTFFPDTREKCFVTIKNISHILWRFSLTENLWIVESLVPSLSRWTHNYNDQSALMTGVDQNNNGLPTESRRILKKMYSPGIRSLAYNHSITAEKATCCTKLYTIPNIKFPFLLEAISLFSKKRYLLIIHTEPTSI